MSLLEKSILATLAYYDALDRPLTGWEVFKYLIRHQTSIDGVLGVLENSVEIKKHIAQKNGFYFLRGRESLVEERIKRHKIADTKWQKSRRLIKILQIIPFIRLVAVSGSLAMSNTKEESDIDLLVVAKNGRIWTCRGLLTLFLHLCRRRRHGVLTKDRFCLNHYLTDQSLHVPYRSLYNGQTYLHLVPMWTESLPIYRRFQLENGWIKDFVRSYPDLCQGYRRTITNSGILSVVREAGEFLLDGFLGSLIEGFLQKMQSRRIAGDPLTYRAGGRVVFDGQQLEFHPLSPEKMVLEKYNRKLTALGLDESTYEQDSGLTI